MLRNAKLHALLLYLLFYSSGCHEITHIILDDPIELRQVEANSTVLSLALHQLGSLKETGKLVNPRGLGFPRGHITSSYTFEMQIKGKDFRIWATPKKYGRDGKISYYFDTATCRRYGKDKKGEMANSKDTVIPTTVYKPRADLDSIEVPIEDSFKEYYPCSQKTEEKMNETELVWQSWYVDDKTGWKLVQNDHK